MKNARTVRGLLELSPDVGTRVAYEDMANPLCEGVVCDIETTRWGTSYMIAWCGHRAGEISPTDLRQHGWRLA